MRVRVLGTVELVRDGPGDGADDGRAGNASVVPIGVPDPDTAAALSTGAVARARRRSS